jgi:hypothetical protein
MRCTPGIERSTLSDEKRRRAEITGGENPAAATATGPRAQSASTTPNGESA